MMAGNDRLLQLPTLAATAWCHHKLSPQYNDLVSFLNEVENFAITDHASALLKDDALSDAQRNQIAESCINTQAYQKTIYCDPICVCMLAGSIRSY